jgi:hypothetical protein
MNKRNVLLTCRRSYPKNYQKSDELSQNNNYSKAARLLRSSEADG